jgi:hypothetical protein
MTFDPANPLAGVALSTVVGTPGQSGVLLGPVPAGLNCPMGVAFAAGPIPTLFISDSAENAILQVQ